MQQIMTLCFILFIHLPLLAIEINPNSTNISILNKASIFLDKNSSSISTVVNINNSKSTILRDLEAIFKDKKETCKCKKYL